MATEEDYTTEEEMSINDEASDDEKKKAQDDDEVTRDDEDTHDDEDDEDDDDETSPQRKAVAKAEKARLRALTKGKRAELEKLRQQQNADASANDEERRQLRLKYLLQQAEVFQHFSGSTAEEAKKGKGKRGRTKGRHAGMTEDVEDEELLRDELAEEAGVERAHRLQVQPSVIKNGTMREYQLQGLNWLIHLYDNGINGILADEMGLGKTLQTISLLGYLYEFRGITGPHLVLVPKSTLHNWLNEFRKWCPTINAFKFHGNAEERERQKAEFLQPGKFDVCITSYEMVIKEKNHFKRFHWRYVIIDEAHRIKNENSILSTVVRTLKTNYRLLITGTPLQNNLHELWALLNFLLPEIFASSEKFEEWFSIGSGGQEKEAEVVQQLHKVLRPFLLRRVKSDVERGLPPKKETILKIGMSEMQRTWYAALLQRDIEALNGGADRGRLLNIVMQLRKCCNHPYLFQGAEPGPPFMTGEHLIENAGKMILLDKLLTRLQERGSRVLIFSQMSRMLDILEDYCLYRTFKYCRIDGNTSGEDREYMIDEFNKDNSERFVFLLSTRAGGLGINLATADIVILYDSDWNPQMDLQAMDRAHRIGQKKEVHVYRFCTESSIEEKVIEKAYKKLRLDALVIQQGRLTQNQSKVGKEDLLSMVRYGAERVFSGSEITKITDADIEAIIQKGEQETKDLNDKLKQFTDQARQFTLDGGMNAYDYKDEDDGKDGNIDSLKHLMASNWVDPGERKRKRVTSYAENEFFKQPMISKKGERASGPRLPKMPQLLDFQFYNTKRLTELFERENAWQLHLHHLKQKIESMKAQGASEEVIEAELTSKPEDPQPLTEEELEERDQLLECGFSNWSRRDFNAFVRACEKYGRKSLTQIAKDVEGKTEEEVRTYAKVFWERYTDLNDAERIIKNIEKGEAKIQRQTDIMTAIEKKMNRYKNPWLELKIQYGANKGKAYTEEEDRFLLCMMHRLGYGMWDDLKAEIRKSWRFRFDWFFKSRTPQELARRCDTLIRLIEKEIEDLEATTGTRKSVGGRKSIGGEGAASGRKRKAKAMTDGDGGTPNGDAASSEPPSKKPTGRTRRPSAKAAAVAT